MFKHIERGFRFPFWVQLGKFLFIGRRETREEEKVRLEKRCTADFDKILKARDEGIDRTDHLEIHELDACLLIRRDRHRLCRRILARAAFVRPDHP